jgi:hypothetical protein
MLIPGILIQFLLLSTENMDYMPQIFPRRVRGAGMWRAVHILRYLVDGMICAVENHRNPATPRALSARMEASERIGL